MGLFDSFNYDPMGYTGMPNTNTGESVGLMGNIKTWLRDPRNQAGLQAFGEALSKAGAPSQYKMNWGGALGQGLSAMNQGGMQYDQQQFQKQMQELQMQQLKQSLNQKTDPRSMLGKIDIDKFDPASISEFLSSGDPSKLVALRKKEFAPNGMAVDPYNIPTGQSYAAPRQVDTGGAIGFLDGDLNQTGPMIPKSQSPDSKASNALGWANYGIAKENQNMPVIQNDANGGMFAVDRRSGMGMPVIGQDGKPLMKGDKPLTEFQGKSTGFAMRSAEADKIISELGGDGIAGAAFKKTMDNIPVLGAVTGPMANLTASDAAQKREQAERNFVNAILRQESGAAIPFSEFDNAAKQYFPRVGDSKAVIAQKKQNREMAIKGLTISAGPGAKNIGKKPITIGGFTIEQVD